MAEQIQQQSIYGINLSAEEIEEWNNREKTTYLEMEIPLALEEKLSKLIEEEIKKYHNSKDE